MKHTVDIETWERRDNYAFFRNFLNSWISVATDRLHRSPCGGQSRGTLLLPLLPLRRAARGQ
ncbi:MAG: hypothetical protein ACLRM8_01420 [Alistipes sp.]